MTRRQIIEAIVFLPAMVVLAAATFVGFYGLILVGNWLVGFYYDLLRNVLALPHALAATLTVFAVPLTFLSVARLIHGARRRPSQRL